MTAALSGGFERRAEVRPPWAFRLPGGSMDGVWRRRAGVLERLVVVGDEAAVVRAAQPAPQRVVLGAWGPSAQLATEALDWLRWALGVDEDLRAFHEAFRWDPLVGASVRRAPWLRVTRRPAFEALAWAVCEQLIELVRAAAIQRRIAAALGPRCAQTGLRAGPGARALAGCAPARLESFGLAPSRSLTLVRVAREVARGRVDLAAGDHERGWARLRTLPGVGTWTVECLALHGQGRYDAVPAGDLGLRKLLGRIESGGQPAARVDEATVRERFGAYGEWAGLAAAHALSIARATAAAGGLGPSRLGRPSRADHGAICPGLAAGTAKRSSLEGSTWLSIPSTGIGPHAGSRGK